MRRSAPNFSARRRQLRQSRTSRDLHNQSCQDISFTFYQSRTVDTLLPGFGAPRSVTRKLLPDTLQGNPIAQGDRQQEQQISNPERRIDEGAKSQACCTTNQSLSISIQRTTSHSRQFVLPRARWHPKKAPDSNDQR